VAIVFDSIDICGLRKTHFNQLLSYIEDAESLGWYYGNKKQFNQRHDDLCKWLEGIIDHAGRDSVIIPKKLK
jgi:hypothetical protein